MAVYRERRDNQSDGNGILRDGKSGYNPSSFISSEKLTVAGGGQLTYLPAYINGRNHG